MTALLVSDYVARLLTDDIAAVRRDAGRAFEVLVLPEDPDARLTDEHCTRIEAAFYSSDVLPRHARSFFSAVRRAPNLRWMQVLSAGLDHPIFGEMLDRGIRVSNASGTTAGPIAQTAIGALLQLARPFGYWRAGQAERRWAPIDDADDPPDLAGQTVLVLGLGEIGTAIARIAQALGCRVIGVRRSPRRPDDPVDEVHPPSELLSLLPRTDWLVIACPLTDETRGLIDATALASLPRTAHVLNIARGEIVDEPALIEALQAGRLAGAYLDVFTTEPLPADSPLWALPNVILTPHNSSASRGNERRLHELFVRNLRHWLRDEPLEREVRAR